MARKNPLRKSSKTESVVKEWNEEKVRKSFERMGYGFVGDHSAVQVCLYTKSAVRGGDVCFKEKFYGISSAGCAQMTPAALWCEHNCVHCWRPMEKYLGKKKDHGGSPVEILDGIVAKRKELMIGFKGREGIDLGKFEKSLEPSLYTMSLSGEPTLYTRIGEMFKEIRKRGAVSFLVTNGQNPDVMKNLRGEYAPTQIALSTNSSNKEDYLEWHRSLNSDSWERFNQTLDIFKDMDGEIRRVIRLTLTKKGSEESNLKEINNMKESDVIGYSDLILKGRVDLVHIKGYMSVGFARGRMGYDKQPWFDEVRKFAVKILDELNSRGAEDGYEIGAEDIKACIVMLKKKGVVMKIGEI